MTINRKKIKEVLQRDKFSKYFGGERYNLGLSDLSIELENKGLINFTLEYRENEMDSWLQAEYFCKGLNKTIIIDYDFPDTFESYDDFMNSLQFIETTIEELKEKIISDKEKYLSKITRRVVEWLGHDEDDTTDEEIAELVMNELINY